jgi:hypothetical protein
MNNTPFISIIILYILLGLSGLYFILLWLWQIKVFRGKRMKNVDGSFDYWHEQNIDYGFSFADIVIGCPVGLLGVVLTFLHYQIGFYLMAMVSFWFLWVNLATTVTSLKFRKQKLNFSWFMTFPFGSLMGLAYVIWTMFYYDVIFCSGFFNKIGIL